MIPKSKGNPNAAYVPLARLKAVLLGPHGAGKTCLATALEAASRGPFSEAFFDAEMPPTVGCAVKVLRLRGAVVQLWDTGGQERFKCLVPMYAHGAGLFLLVFKPTDTEADLRLWEAAAAAEMGLDYPLCGGPSGPLPNTLYVLTHSDLGLPFPAWLVRKRPFVVSSKLGLGVHSVLCEIQTHLSELTFQTLPPLPEEGKPCCH